MIYNNDSTAGLFKGFFIEPFLRQTTVENLGQSLWVYLRLFAKIGMHISARLKHRS